MKRPLRRGVIDCVPLQNAVLCADCECISESRNDVCGVCGGRSLVNLARLLGSAAQHEAGVGLTDPLMSRELETLDSTVPRQPRRFP
jgi:hypothetical protein